MTSKEVTKKPNPLQFEKTIKESLQVLNEDLGLETPRTVINLVIKGTKRSAKLVTELTTKYFKHMSVKKKFRRKWNSEVYETSTQTDSPQRFP